MLCNLMPAVSVLRLAAKARFLASLGHLAARTLIASLYF